MTQTTVSRNFVKALAMLRGLSSAHLQTYYKQSSPDDAPAWRAVWRAGEADGEGLNVLRSQPNIACSSLYFFTSRSYLGF